MHEIKHIFGCQIILILIIIRLGDEKSFMRVAVVSFSLSGVFHSHTGCLNIPYSSFTFPSLYPINNASRAGIPDFLFTVSEVTLNDVLK